MSDCVYLVDDEPDILVSVRGILTAVGIETVLFHNAEDVLSACRTASPLSILTDAQMPGMNGIQLMESLNRLGVQVPVLVMTGFASVDLAVAAMKAGAVDFIEKPFERQSLLEKIQTCMTLGLRRRQRWIRESGARRVLSSLTNRERDVFELVVAGHPNKNIAVDLGISIKTVEVYRARIMDKAGAASLADLVRLAVLASPDEGPAPAARYAVACL